jgi:outer membrane protein assembly factor BamB
MGRVLEIWRSWSTRRRLALVGAVTLLLAGGAVAAYAMLKRPGDVVNEGAVFQPREEKKQKKPTVKTVDWPVYGYDDKRTRYLPTKEVHPPYRPSEWSFQAGKLLEFSPIIADDVLYFADKDALFRAMDADTGKVTWKRDIGSLNASSPAYAHGRVFAVTLEPGDVVAMRARDGKVLWRHPLPGRTESSPAVYNGKVIVGCECGTVYALDERTGAVRWTVDTAGPVKGGVAVDDGVAYFGNYAGELYAVEASNGAVKWQTGTQGSSFGRSGPIYSTPAIAFGRVYVGSIDSRVYSFEQATGELAWSHSTGDWVYPAPAVADTRGAPPTIYIGSKDQNFYALDARDGSVRWQQDVGGIVLGAASVIGEVVYVGVIGPNIGSFGFDVNSGKKVFEHELGEYNPVISDGQRLYLTGSSAIRAFESYTPEQLRARRERLREAERRQRQRAKEERAKGGERQAGGANRKPDQGRRNRGPRRGGD